MKMLAMRRENDQMFGSTASNAINNNTISATNDTVADNCCSSSSYQEGKPLPQDIHFIEYRSGFSHSFQANGTHFCFVPSHLLSCQAINTHKKFILQNKRTFAYKQTHAIKDSRLNNSANPSGLEEYVDILQVQSLLLDSTPSTSNAATSNACTSNATTIATNSTGGGATRHHRPRVNIQKAAEYSTATMANSTACPTSTTTAATATTPSAQLQGTYWEPLINSHCIQRQQSI